MDFKRSPSLPNAHQQIRLDDIQASAQKWIAAIEYYLHAIEYFKAIQENLHDHSLISNIQAQIIQCEKHIQFCRLKDRSEQTKKLERHSTIIRAHSTSNTKPSAKLNRIMQRYHTQQFENALMLGGHDDIDSFSAVIFPNNTLGSSSKHLTSMMAKKNRKDESQKMEELQMSYEALKNHLKTAFDDIDRLKNENNELRTQKESIISQQLIDVSLLSTSHEEKLKDIKKSDKRVEFNI